MKKIVLVAVIAVMIVFFGIQVCGAVNKAFSANQSMYDQADRVYAGKNGPVGW